MKFGIFFSWYEKQTDEIQSKTFKNTLCYVFKKSLFLPLRNRPHLPKGNEKFPIPFSGKVFCSVLWVRLIWGQLFQKVLASLLKDLKPCVVFLSWRFWLFWVKTGKFLVGSTSHWRRSKPSSTDKYLISPQAICNLPRKQFLAFFSFIFRFP